VRGPLGLVIFEHFGFGFFDLGFLGSPVLLPFASTGVNVHLQFGCGSSGTPEKLQSYLHLIEFIK
jgi:hypothetical protein